MELSGKQRREFAAQANRLKAVLTVAPENIHPGVVETLHAHFRKHPLVKVRFATDQRDVVATAAAELATKADCALVQRVGRVAAFYRAGESETAPAADL